MSTQTQVVVLIEDYQEFRSSGTVDAWYLKMQRPPQHTTTLLSLPPDTSSPLPSWDKATLPHVNYDPKFTTEYFAVRESVSAGLGAFAIKDIKEGQVVITEAPLFLAKEIQIWDKYQGLSEEDSAAFLSLHAYPRDGGEITSDNKVTSIFSTNRFKTAGDENGIFIKCSRFNHQCRPHSNCAYWYYKEDNQLVVTARKDIPKGQEITISYSDDPDVLPKFYGFKCNCPCCMEKPASTEVDSIGCQVL